MAKTSFTKEADQFNEALGQLFNRAIRSALLAGLLAATKFTRHDSSNAAVHWMLAGADGRKSRPWQRKLGRIQDLRGTKGVRGPAREPVPPVGYRDDEGKNASAASAFVRDRETQEVLDRLVVGRSAETRFYFYSAVGEDEEYAENAQISEAGEAAVARTLEVAERHIAAGNVRRRAR